MPVTLHHVVVDAHDLPKLAQFWTQALGWRVLSEREHEIVIGPDVNRVHLDLTTGAPDREAEIERLLSLGASRVDIGQTGKESWTVLADPRGTSSA